VRILNVAQTYFPYLAEGGRPAKVRILSRNLAHRGHHVTVLTVNLGAAEWTQAGIVPEKTSLGWRLVEDGVEAIYLPEVGRYRAITINPRLVQFCRASLGDFDLAHFYGLYDLLGPSVSYFCRRQGVPYVIEPMGMFRPIDRSFRLKQMWHRSVGSRFWRDAAQIVATSELEQQELLEDGVPPTKVVMRYNGIDMKSSSNPTLRGVFRSKWNIGPDEPLIVFLSRLIPRKGADLLIEAFAQSCPQSGRLVIAGPEGEPGYRAYLEKHAIDSGVGLRIIFTGPIYDGEKNSLLADADLFALPSQYENFANVAAEAMAFGVPVIITHSCGICSVVEGVAGLVVIPKVAAIADALRTMICDKVLYARMQAGCRLVADRLDWNTLTEQMEGYYTEVLAQTNAVH
jgi:glycosyltransferase involved in cell wall biosynthesis